ncbi:MAG: hypothetical protein GX468_03215 [Thermotogaceae bacterium]|nr:hypothetical protein [Thermotogaceae bacterium]
MYKKILLLMLALVLILSGCGMFNQSATPRTNVYIVDPYGNNLMVDGKINGNTIKTDAKGLYVEAAIESAEVQLVEPLGIFKVKDISVDPKKSVTIILEKSTNKGIKLLRTADGKLMFYAIGYGDTPYFQVWLKDQLAGSTMVGLNKEQMLLAGNWLVGVGKPLGTVKNNISKDEIVAKLAIPATKAPQVASFEVIK